MNPQKEIIPNRLVWVYHNVLYHPSGGRTLYGHCTAQDAWVPGAGIVNVPNPARAVDDVQIVGNLIDNGPNLPLGFDGITTIDAATIPTANRINTQEPDLVAPGAADYRPVNAGELATLAGVAIPDFSWADAPHPPTGPTGTLVNSSPLNRDGAARSNHRPGAY
ncbi:MAG: hypothetical protein IT204_22545 [Fimbriimonadaceae bacterium]|nr:hypothetical protein [Fimbriimonadaceae bacterium]